MKKADKEKVLANSLKGEKGLIKAVLLTELTGQKIGQYNVLQHNTKTADLAKGLIKVIDLAVNGTEKDEALKAVQAEIKGSGFASAESVINYTYQLKEGSLINLQSVFAEKNGIELVQKSVADLLNNYVYTS